MEMVELKTEVRGAAGEAGKEWPRRLLKYSYRKARGELEVKYCAT